MPDHHHRSGSLRQVNKKNKRGRASKRSVKRFMGGKVQSVTTSGGANNKNKQAGTSSKQKRVLMAQQKRQNHKTKLLNERRGILSTIMGAGSKSVTIPPKLIGVISLSASHYKQAEKDESNLFSFFKNNQSADPNKSNKDILSPVLKFDVHPKQKIQVLTNCHSFAKHYHHQMGVKNENNASDDLEDDMDLGNENEDHHAEVMGALDLCRVCDLVIFTINGDFVQEERKLLKQQLKEQQLDKSDGVMTISTFKTNATTADLCGDLFISQRGEDILHACKNQGLPTVLTLLTQSGDQKDSMIPLESRDLAKLQKTRNEMKRFGQRLATTEFGQHAKFMDCVLTDSPLKSSNDSTTEALVRYLCTGTAIPSKWIDTVPRPYMISTPSPTSNSVTSGNNNGYVYDPNTKELHISGHIRGNTPFSIYNLIHVPHLGTFQISKIREHQIRSPNSSEDTILEGDNDPLKMSDTLEMFATPDALEGEQNLVGFDEEDDIYDGDDDAIGGDDGMDGKGRPAGWSDYQSAWLDAIDPDAEDVPQDNGELAKALNKKSSDNDDAMLDDDEEDYAITEQRRSQRKDDLEFPDEVELTQDQIASERFARYRSLKSFRKSYWDPKENLPDAYAKVYHFSNFRFTQKDIYGEQQDVIQAMVDYAQEQKEKNDKKNKNKSGDGDIMMEEDNDAKNDGMDTEEEEDDLLEGCVLPGSFITITLSNVPSHLYNKRVSTKAPLSLCSLLPHENKVTVLHFGMTSKIDYATPKDVKASNSDLAIKTKDLMYFRCGWRSWYARPVFSQHNLNSDKHKLERFLPPNGAHLAASVYGPVSYTPCPVLMFNTPFSSKTKRAAGATSDASEATKTTVVPSSEGEFSKTLVAVGSVLGADADRIVIKRIIMTGFPTRVHKRHATVKYMFYNPEDVKWFKPAGLTTKHGLQGHIIESVGDHGTMKCLFNQPIKQHDTVCLPLYKRIYPKFAPQAVEDEFGNVVTKDLVIY